MLESAAAAAPAPLEHCGYRLRTSHFRAARLSLHRSHRRRRAYFRRDYAVLVHHFEPRPRGCRSGTRSVAVVVAVVDTHYRCKRRHYRPSAAEGRRYLLDTVVELSILHFVVARLGSQWVADYKEPAGVLDRSMDPHRLRSHALKKSSA